MLIHFSTFRVVRRGQKVPEFPLAGESVPFSALFEEREAKDEVREDNWREGGGT